MLITDPWRIFLTTDHPNGACFWRYPEIIHLLMNADFRRERIQALPKAALSRIVLPESNREYTLDEIAIITSAGPARALGMKQKGHLGVGADGDRHHLQRQSRSRAHVRLSAVRDQRGRVGGRRRGNPLAQQRPRIRRAAQLQSRRSMDSSANDSRSTIRSRLRITPSIRTASTACSWRSVLTVRALDRRSAAAPFEATSLPMIVLTLKDQPSVPLEAEILSPDHFDGLDNAAIRALPVFLGKRQLRVDDFFTVDGEREGATRSKFAGMPPK